MLASTATSTPVIVYAGAGLSMSSGLPSGAGLAGLLHQRLLDIGQAMPGVPSDDLLAIADFVTAQPGGLEALQDFSARVAPFSDAPPSPQHVALALLILEGAVLVLTTNWDTCIERALPDALIPAVVTNDDRMRYRGPLVYKVHGCVTRPSTLLISSEQLRETPIWAAADVASALGYAPVVFLGIGDVAPYVRVRLERLLDNIGSPANVRIATPSISAKWAETQWSSLLPALEDSHKMQMGAGAFADGLLRAWVLLGFRACTEAATGQPGLAAAFLSLRSSLTASTAPRVLQWLRLSRGNPQATASTMHAPGTVQALLALAVHAKGKLLRLPPRGPVEVDAEPVHLVIGDFKQGGPAVAALARMRLAQLRALGDASPTEAATVICAGYHGRLEPGAAAAEVGDIMGASDPSDVIDGPTMGPIQLLHGPGLVERSEDA